MVIFLIVVVLWVGLLLGVSFLATPVKFLAPSLSMPVALDIGRHTFGVFQWFEMLLAGMVLVIALTVRRTLIFVSAAMLPAGIVILQVLWLRPALDARVSMILKGISPPASHLHEIYILLDVAKLVVLVVLSGWIIWRFRAGGDLRMQR